jgi:hypothetical protein
MKQETVCPTIESLSNADIDKLIADHWREIKGLIREIRRRKQIVLDTNSEPLGVGPRDGRTP